MKVDTSPITSEAISLRARVLSLLDVTIEFAREFLSLNKIPGAATQKLLGLLIERLTANLRSRIMSMDDAEMEKQILYIRDQVIPYLLGEEARVIDPGSPDDPR